MTNAGRLPSATPTKLTARQSAQKNARLPFWCNRPEGEKSRIAVRKGETCRLEFGVLIYGIPSSEAVDIAAAYRAFLQK